jgi:hypothetical protein
MSSRSSDLQGDHTLRKSPDEQELIPTGPEKRFEFIKPGLLINAGAFCQQSRLTNSVKRTVLPSPKTLAENDYVHCWTCYRRLRGVVIAVFVAAIVEVRFFLPGIVIAGTFFFYFLLAMWLANWNCPRCNRSFFRYAFLRSLFGARCFYCQFPKWGISDTGDVILRPKFPLGWKAEAVEEDTRKK